MREALCSECMYNRDCKLNIDPSKCNFYKEKEPFKMPLLMHLVNSDQTTIVNKLLSLFDIRFIEKTEYPYFILDHHGKKN